MGLGLRNTSQEELTPEVEGKDVRGFHRGGRGGGTAQGPLWLCPHWGHSASWSSASSSSGRSPFAAGVPRECRSAPLPSSCYSVLISSGLTAFGTISMLITPARTFLSDSAQLYPTAWSASPLLTRGRGTADKHLTLPRPGGNASFAFHQAGHPAGFLCQ